MRASPTLQLEAGVRFERSTITQSGDVELERTFNYPKPRVVATWSPTKDNQLRLRVEREVGQLNFEDFISNVNLSSRVLSAGNAELEPDKTWVYEAAFEKRFLGNAAAVLTLRDPVGAERHLVERLGVDGRGQCGDHRDDWNKDLDP